MSSDSKVEFIRDLMSLTVGRFGRLSTRRDPYFLDLTQVLRGLQNESDVDPPVCGFRRRRVAESDGPHGTIAGEGQDRLSLQD